MSSRSTHSPVYRVSYAGNLGEGQDLLSLLINLSKDQETINIMRSSGFCFNIYGSGSQAASIKRILSSSPGSSEPSPLEGIVQYHGLISTESMPSIYQNSDALMLHLALFNSLSMVIPSKIFEYSSTPLPIIFGILKIEKAI